MMVKLEIVYDTKDCGHVQADIKRVIDWCYSKVNRLIVHFIILFSAYSLQF